jgi:hypothetical protein
MPKLGFPLPNRSLLICLVAAAAGACSTAEPASPGTGGSATGGAPRGGTGGGGAGTGGSATGGAAPAGTGGSAPADAGAGPGTGGAPGAALPLPVLVTTHFGNQGWFADTAVSASFKPGSTTIKQGDSIGGPCAARDPAARGKCLRVVYTPPAGLVPNPAGSFVGVFFLTTLMKDHPETVPPSKIGEANWGAEPGLAIAPGAKRISFSAAAETAGLTVTFKAGTDRDAFLVPETPVPLTTGWTTHSLSLEGKSYGANVLGGFAWVLLDTTKPATFYLDNIVWE